VTPSDDLRANRRGDLNRTASSITLRPLRPEDLPAVRRLHDASFRGLAASHYDAATLDAHTRLVMAPDYAPDVLRSDLWLAEEDGRLLGSAGWIVSAPGEGRIRKVFVHPDAARRGLGTRLVLAAEERARAAGCTRFVLRAYLDAVPLYERLGYVADRPGEMELGQDRAMPVLFMRKAK
jgi:putative acetyltransferase